MSTISDYTTFSLAWQCPTHMVRQLSPQNSEIDYEYQLPRAVDCLERAQSRPFSVTYVILTLRNAICEYPDGRPMYYER